MLIFTTEITDKTIFCFTVDFSGDTPEGYRSVFFLSIPQNH